jgi:hypothetical protein
MRNAPAKSSRSETIRKDGLLLSVNSKRPAKAKGFDTVRDSR